MCPWGLGRTFGGEAESRWVTMHPDACQVLDDGRRVATGCLNQPSYRAFCKEWADAALEAGTDYVFWDEPHWTVPEHVGIDDPERWACCCDVCRELAGWHADAGVPRGIARRLPAGDDGARRRRGRQEHDLPAAADRGVARNQRLGRGRGAAGARRLRDRSVLEELRRAGRMPSSAASPRCWPRPRRGTASGRSSGCRASGSRATTSPISKARSRAAREAGIDDVWTWGYEACGHMTQLATPDSPLVWEAVTRALTGDRRPRPAPDSRARAVDQRGGRRRSPTRSRTRPARSPPRSTRSSSGSARAGGSSTSARARPAGSPLPTRPNADRPSRRT